MTLVKQDNVEGLGDEGRRRALGTLDRLHGRWPAPPAWPLGMGFFVKAPATVIPPLRPPSRKGSARTWRLELPWMIRSKPCHSPPVADFNRNNVKRFTAGCGV